MGVELKAGYSMDRSSWQNSHPSSPGVYRSVTIIPGGPFSSNWKFIRTGASSAFSYEVTY
ncbi:uncharacterized protein METZ01_LOCUS372724, partial [marine metagenome]